MSHSLVVGGTGMLRGVSLELCRRGHAVSVLARTLRRLRELQEEASAFGGDLHPLPLDYRDSAALREALREAGERLGPIRLAVVWIHREAAEAPREVGERVEGDYFHVLPHADAGEPRGHRVGRAHLARWAPRLRYHEVFLGLEIEAGRPRWLTHEEICRGVLEAIDRGLPRDVVGRLP